MNSVLIWELFDNLPAAILLDIETLVLKMKDLLFRSYFRIESQNLNSTFPNGHEQQTRIEKSFCSSDTKTCQAGVIQRILIGEQKVARLPSFPACRAFELENPASQRWKRAVIISNEVELMFLLVSRVSNKHSKLVSTPLFHQSDTLTHHLKQSKGFKTAITFCNILYHVLCTLCRSHQNMTQQG